MKQQTAQLNYLHIAPRKVRQIADLIRKLPVKEAEAQLILHSQRACIYLLKLLRSAIANAQNQKMDKSRLFISKIIVNQGPMLKRFLPRAMGRATPLQKKMSHVLIVLEESEKPVAERFKIIPPPKKEKKAKKETAKMPKAKTSEETKIKKPEKVGFFRKVFSRKSV